MDTPYTKSLPDLVMSILNGKQPMKRSNINSDVRSRSNPDSKFHRKNNSNANASNIAVAEITRFVTIYQKIHVLQVIAAGLMVNEYEEERFAEYQYQLEVYQ
ncbi:hypothetical protein Glove_326g85 [Diversispora epigaea]|uniref:Uncharacterized protein n=1 Tax=Diversispora epigaea TaxID=1348612 RepID=A0A397HU38_9GLOM|nr:hypothetical protein Glove_326g85 [Diversispora epigaea]